MNKFRWNAPRRRIAETMRAEGASFPKIAAAIAGANKEIVRWYFRKRENPEAIRRHYDTANRKRRELREVRTYIHKNSITGISLGMREKIPAFVMEEAARRCEERSQMSEAALLMGEPPPSQSALAQLANGASSQSPSPTPPSGEAPAL